MGGQIAPDDEGGIFFQLFGYLFYLNRRQHEMKKEIARLQNVLNQASEEE